MLIEAQERVDAVVWTLGEEVLQYPQVRAEVGVTDVPLTEATAVEGSTDEAIELIDGHAPSVACEPPVGRGELVPEVPLSGFELGRHVDFLGAAAAEVFERELGAVTERAIELPPLGLRRVRPSAFHDGPRDILGRHGSCLL